jgi:hypothetical protein
MAFYDISYPKLKSNILAISVFKKSLVGRHGGLNIIGTRMDIGSISNGFT